MKKHAVVTGKIALTVVLAAALAVIFTIMLNTVLPNSDEIPEQIVYLTNGPKSLFTLLIPLAIMLKWFEKQRTWQLGVNTNDKFRTLIVSTMYGILLTPFTFLTIYIMGGAKIVAFHFESTIVLSFCVGVILSICDSFTEELLFRGYVQGLVKHNYGTVPSIIIPSIIFAALHSLGHDIFANPYYVLNLALAGLFLSLLREISGSLWVPIGVHLAWNTFNSIVGTEDNIVTIDSLNDMISGGKYGISNGLAYTLLYVMMIAALVFILKRKTTDLSV